MTITIYPAAAGAAQGVSPNGLGQRATAAAMLDAAEASDWHAFARVIRRADAGGELTTLCSPVFALVIEVGALVEDHGFGSLNTVRELANQLARALDAAAA